MPARSAKWKELWQKEKQKFEEKCLSERVVNDGLPEGGLWRPRDSGIDPYVTPNVSDKIDTPNVSDQSGFLGLQI